MRLDADTLERMGDIQRALADPTAPSPSKDDLAFLRDWTVELADRLIRKRDTHFDVLAIRDALTGESSLSHGGAYIEHAGPI